MTTRARAGANLKYVNWGFRIAISSKDLSINQKLSQKAYIFTKKEKISNIHAVSSDIVQKEAFRLLDIQIKSYNKSDFEKFRKTYRNERGELPSPNSNSWRDFVDRINKEKGSYGKIIGHNKNRFHIYDFDQLDEDRISIQMEVEFEYEKKGKAVFPIRLVKFGNNYYILWEFT